MVWSLALCPDDTKQDSVVYGAEFGVVFPAKGPRTASIQEGLFVPSVVSPKNKLYIEVTTFTFKL